MADEYTGRADFEANLKYLFNNQTVLADIRARLNVSAVNGKDVAGLIACQGDVNIILGQIAAVLALLKAMDSKLDRILAAGAGTVDVAQLAEALAPKLPPINYQALAKAVNDDAAQRLAN